MELRYLRYFVAVAQTRNFTRAAELLGISQPPLSQQIRRLEEELGTLLLKRLTRSVELTEAGESFLQDAQQILELTSHAQEKVKSIARGVSGKLSLGFASSVVFEPALFRILREFQQHYSGVTLLPREASMMTIIQELQEGLLDAAFVRLPCENSKFLNLKLIMSEDMRIVLPSNHPLTKKNALSLGELSAMQMITFPKTLAPGLYDMVLTACLRAGFQPRMGPQAPQISSMVGMVAAGFGFALVPASFSTIVMPGVSFQACEDNMLKTDIALAWRRSDNSPVLSHLLHVLS